MKLKNIRVKDLNKTFGLLMRYNANSTRLDKQTKNF